MIYLVEDDESIRELVIYTLKSQGFEAKGFERPSLFWRALEKEQPALLLLDVMLPEEDGISILKKLRVRPDTRKLPIIMLTAKSSEYAAQGVPQRLAVPQFHSRRPGPHRRLPGCLREEQGRAVRDHGQNDHHR